MLNEKEEEQFEVSEKDKRKQQFSQKKRDKQSSPKSFKVKLFSKGRKSRPSTRDLLDSGDEDD